MVDVVDPPSEWSEQVMVASTMVYIIIPELFAGVHPVPAGQQAHPFCVGTKPPAADKLSGGNPRMASSACMPELTQLKFRCLPHAGHAMLWPTILTICTNSGKASSASLISSRISVVIGSTMAQSRL